MSIFLRIVSIGGISLFAFLFLLTFSSAEMIEKPAKGFVKHQIEKEIKNKYTYAKESDTSAKTLAIAERLGFKKDKIFSEIDSNLPERIASIVASMCSYECEKEKSIANPIRTSHLEEIKKIQIAQNTLGDIVRDKYLEIVGKLKTDFRIFSASNLTMFIMLLAVSFLKPRAMTHLFVPAMLLALATTIASCIYIFGQNWFYTILYNDYMGMAYLAYIGVIFGFLLDIVLNKARVTCEIINTVCNAIGSAFSVLPC